MIDKNNRIKDIRTALSLNQNEFGEKIGLTKSSISNIEKGTRNVTEQHIRLINGAFNVSEEWLRNGKGDMFLQQTEFSLDQYAEKNKISVLEIEIIKSYMEVDANIREGILTHFKEVFARHEESAATTEVDPIEQELKDYRLELEAEKKGATSSALHAKDEGETS